MKNNFSESMASDMLARLKSAENVALFRKDYVVAEDENDAKKKDSEDSSDSSCADDNDAKKNEDSDEDCSMADDSEDESDADDVSLALDSAVASLLNASAALDTVGFEKSASLSLKLASFVAEAKKKSDAKKKSKKDSKKSTKDSKKSDSTDAKKKKDSKDSKKSDSKKSDSKKSDSKKSNPFAKKK